MFTVFVPGNPAPQGSKRHVGRGIMLESSKRVGPWRDRVRAAVDRARAQSSLRIEGAVLATLEFIMPRPERTPKTRFVFATKKPDVDKLLRAVCDALSDQKGRGKRKVEGVIRDDSQVVLTLAVKRLARKGEEPGCLVTLKELTSEAEMQHCLAILRELTGKAGPQLMPEAA